MCLPQYLNPNLHRYEAECKKLIAKFKTLRNTTQAIIPDISRDFLAKYNVLNSLSSSCPPPPFLFDSHFRSVSIARIVSYAVMCMCMYSQLHKECPAAIHRLVNIGVPATAEHGGGADNQQLAVYAAQTVSFCSPNPALSYSWIQMCIHLNTLSFVIRCNISSR